MSPQNSLTELKTASLQKLDRALADGLFSSPPSKSWFEDIYELIHSTPALDDLYNVRKALSMFVCLQKNQQGSEEISKERRGTDDLYVMWSETMGAVKVGRTSYGAETRAAQLQAGCPDIELMAVHPGNGNLESSLHRELSEFRVGGEWFSVTPEIVAFKLAELRSNP